MTVINLFPAEHDKISEIMQAIDNEDIQKAVFVFYRDGDLEVCPLTEFVNVFELMGVLAAAKNAVNDDWVAENAYEA